jgi:acetyl-CoA carboxylase, biotin carboxylase subunit
MIKKVLIANRGEIAVRIIRTCREMGIRTVAVFSDADRTALHVRYADEAYHIGPSPSNESYLKMDKIIEVARNSKSDAIHPGYGFLSENAEFSRKVTEAGIIFIGPSPEAITSMGDKITARSMMMNTGVPVVPGTPDKISDEKEALEIIQKIGLPVMIKASAGGGGKGMRLIHHNDDIVASLRAAKSEAMAAFNDDSVYIEKYISSPHHIEFQILADSFGNTIHLCERECSVQRRHQKIVEETPSPIMTPELREEMGEKAVAAAKSVNYLGAGTIEFLVDDDLNFYFLEMNTRLQVEHPITERVIGIDLVKEQIKIASGEKLSFRQEDIRQHGHAIECRIYAEDADNNFMPSPGLVKKITEPQGFGVRTDGYVYEGYEIPLYYDPMISKLITWGIDRKEAIGRMRRSLTEYAIMGVKTSINFLKRIMETPDFVKGKYNTHFIENNQDFLFEPCEEPHFFEDLAAIAAYYDYTLETEMKKNGSNGNAPMSLNNWKLAGRKRNVLRTK